MTGFQSALPEVFSAARNHHIIDINSSALLRGRKFIEIHNLTKNENLTDKKFYDLMVQFADIGEFSIIPALTRERKLRQETANIYLFPFLFGLGPLAQPIHQVDVFLEKIGIIRWQIGLGRGHPPLELTTLWFEFIGNNIIECSRST